MYEIYYTKLHFFEVDFKNDPISEVTKIKIRFFSWKTMDSTLLPDH